MTRTTEAPRSSLLTQHLRLLGLEPGALDAAGVAEAQRVAEFELPPLALFPAADADDADVTAVLPLKRGAPLTRRPATWGVAALLAATLAAFVLLRPFGREGVDSPELRIKGESKVWLYWERGGVATAWQSDTTLMNGDRVRAEILASVPTTALVLVESGDGRLLSDPAQALSERLELAAGARDTFKDSVKLVGSNEGERLVVVLCEGGAEMLAQALQDAFPAVDEPTQHQRLPDGCRAESFSLR